MLTNDEMIEGRFLRWHKARVKVAWIKGHLEAGHIVDICTATRVTRCKPKHIDMFKATKTGAYMQAGKRWDCIDFCGFRAHA
jgi:hypothetical protein